MPRHRRGTHRAPAAFTLIELLVTVVILATGIVLILQAFQTSMVALAESRDRMRSAALAHALMVQGELEARGADAIDEYRLRTLYPDYWWRVAIRADRDPACTNANWVKHEVEVMVRHETIGSETDAASWVLDRKESPEEGAR